MLIFKMRRLAIFLITLLGGTPPPQGVQGGQGEGVVITQFQLQDWPEHGRPTSTGSVVEMLDMMPPIESRRFSGQLYKTPENRRLGVYNA